MRLHDSRVLAWEGGWPSGEGTDDLDGSKSQEAKHKQPSAILQPSYGFRA